MALVHFAPYLGIKLIVMSKFDLNKFCSITERQKVTYHPVVPPVLLLLSKSPVIDNYDMSSVRMFSSGAAPLTKELVNDVRRRLKIPVMQGYGLSETSPVTHSQVSIVHTHEAQLIYHPGMGRRGRASGLDRSSAC